MINKEDSSPSLRYIRCPKVQLNRENQWAFFKIDGFAGKRSLLFPPPPPSFHFFALASFFVQPECEKNSFARPEFRSRGTGTLATRARNVIQ